MTHTKSVVDDNIFMQGVSQQNFIAFCVMVSSASIRRFSFEIASLIITLSVLMAVEDIYIKKSFVRGLIFMLMPRYDNYSIRSEIDDTSHKLSCKDSLASWTCFYSGVRR